MESCLNLRSEFGPQPASTCNTRQWLFTPQPKIHASRKHGQQPTHRSTPCSPQVPRSAWSSCAAIALASERSGSSESLPKGQDKSCRRGLDGEKTILYTQVIAVNWDAFFPHPSKNMCSPSLWLFQVKSTIATTSFLLLVVMHLLLVAMHLLLIILYVGHTLYEAENLSAYRRQWLCYVSIIYITTVHYSFAVQRPLWKLKGYQAKSMECQHCRYDFGAHLYLNRGCSNTIMRDQGKNFGLTQVHSSIVSAACVAIPTHQHTPNGHTAPQNSRRGCLPCVTSSGWLWDVALERHKKVRHGPSMFYPLSIEELIHKTQELSSVQVLLGDVFVIF